MPFKSGNSHGAGDLSQNPTVPLWKLRVRVRVRVEIATKPRVPGTLGLEKACQGEHGTGPTKLPTHLSHLGYPWGWGHQPDSKAAFALGLGLR